ncbi:HNH/endonuclease VII fold putative polymorphic toxin [Adlercreutzia sp. R25]|uniref:HNH/endonuclease VII fold putative polymorphic toxin n=1 Tax=Adlercreutzia shanghongiae TaxID=3111773 RepID=UPI002DB63CEF|nr:HNH/endonuclease VII fold putative polymorphic toxin [Adlercreutzia sp. R25]MEC4273897.1 HNH/endonuclease VII fold putative polymorphic toxin [Adlercreutzia sp. R25]
MHRACYDNFFAAWRLGAKSEGVDLAAIGHGVLDLLGFIPGIGAAADAAAAATRAVKKLEAAKGVGPPNLSPEGAGRRGAFREAKRSAGLPVSQQPTSVKPAENKAGVPIPGREYEFSTPRSDDPEHTTVILEHYGHTYKDDPSQNHGPHFNDPAGNHFDY